MAEYIKREAAIKAIEKADYTLIANDADSCESDYLREIIESVPAADVAPVVRCKDCKHCGFCGKETNLEVMGFYGYCSRGEKMEGCEDNG